MTRVITSQKVVMVFVFPTWGTIRTITRILTMDHMTNRKDAMRPFNEEGRPFAGFAIAELGVEVPINVAREGPDARSNDIGAHGNVENQMAHLVSV